MAGTYYPPVGFHFSVAFELFTVSPDDFRFQEVSGLNTEMEMEMYKEGGNNRFTYQLPVRSKYDDITLKRGMLIGSGIVAWCLDALENFNFNPTNLTITLLNEQHLPLHNWYVVNAIPKKLQTSGFNAGENSIVVETLILSYQYFTNLPI